MWAHEGLLWTPRPVVQRALGTIPSLFVLGTSGLPATGMCCDWEQWEEEAGEDSGLLLMVGVNPTLESESKLEVMY